MRTLFALAVILWAVPVFAEDWTTSDGKTYVDVKVIKVEPDAVTILHKDGGALVPLAKLPPPIQKKYNYDPVKAKAAADARAKADADNGKALQAEIDLADKKKQERIVSEAAAKAAATTNQP